MQPERKKEWAARAILAALPAALFADVLLGVNVLFTRDITPYHYPLRRVLREIVSRGEFPYWNPFIAAGQPLAANPAHQLFYPPTWLIFLPDFNLGFHLHALVHLHIAAFGMYALLRSMRTGRTASVLAGLSFALGGLLVSELNLFPFLFSTAWIPWICLFARRALHGGSRRDFALAVLCLGMQLLVGEPTTTLQTGALLGLYALFRGEGLRARRLGLVAAICAAATLIAAVQILPALDHFSDSVRARGLPWTVVSRWSMPPLRIAEFLNPEFLGKPDPVAVEESWAAGIYPGQAKPFFLCIYPGLLVVAGVITGLVLRRRGTALYLTIVAISLTASIGAHTPMLRMLYDAGVASAVRYPEKFLIMGIFASVVYAGRALDAVLRGDAEARRALGLAALGIAGSASLIAIISVTAAWEPLFRWAFRVPAGLDISARLPVARGTWNLAAIRALALVMLVLAMPRMRSTLAGSLLLLFVFADLGALVPRYAPRVDSSYYNEPAFSRALPRNRDDYRIYHLGQARRNPAESDAYYRPRPDFAWIYCNTFAPYSGAAYGYRLALDDDFDLTTLVPSEDVRAAFADLSRSDRNWLQKAVTMSNVQYCVVYRDPARAFAEARDLREIQPVAFRFAGKNPRYWFARQLFTIRDRHDFVEQLRTLPYVPGMTFVEAPAFRPAPARILAVRETTQSARLEVEAAGKAFLVMSVTPHKYWRITLDGVPAEAVRANVGYQGVVVPRGRHVVEMRYANPLVAASGAVSLAALLALFLFVRRVPAGGPASAV